MTGRNVQTARKVVGVGGGGTRCDILLLLGRDDRDPLFLQVKEAQASVLEPFLGASQSGLASATSVAPSRTRSRGRGHLKSRTAHLIRTGGGGYGPEEPAAIEEATAYWSRRGLPTMLVTLGVASVLYVPAYCLLYAQSANRACNHTARGN